ncbi:hypothetical protein AWC32_02635 [Mycobacterium xenopi]|nr:hypothetical protein AWC32_02635 [Mycobacterium xenopi]
MPFLAATMLLPPPAVADSADTLRAAVDSVRSASCAPLRPDPLVESTAEDVNRSTAAWLDHAGRVAPVDDPLPLLKDRGFGGKKARLVQGAGRTSTDAIKGLLLEGYLDIPDCSYTEYGVSLIRNRTTNYVLAAMVLAA